MFEPVQLELSATAKINGESFKVHGVGFVRCPGVYEATLTYSSLPVGFPPGLFATFLTSACCNSVASTRGNTKNLGQTGATRYKANREISAGDDNILRMNAEAILQGGKVLIKADIEGTFEAKCGRYSHGIYYITAEPSEGGKVISGFGEGSIFDSEGAETNLVITQKFDLLEPDVIPNPLEKREFRVLTEDGELIGLTYKQRIHSICEGEDTFAAISRRHEQG